MNGIFIGGMIKSGTSLVRRLLQAHAEVISGLETYWFDLYENYENLNSVRGAGLKGQAMVTDTQRLQRLSEFYSIPIENLIQLYEREKDAIGFIKSFFIELTTLRCGHYTTWVEKTPGNAIYAQQIVAANNSYIHVLRHPADVWYSCKRDEKFETIHEFIHTYKRYQDPIHKQQQLNLKIFVYEKFIKDQQSTQNALYDFVGLKSAKHNLSRVSDNGHELALVAKVSNKTSSTLLRLEDPIDDRSIGVRRDLPEFEISLIQRELNHYLPDTIMNNYKDSIL